MRMERQVFGLSNAIILETGKVVCAPVITGDPHFKGLDNTIYIGDREHRNKFSDFILILNLIRIPNRLVKWHPTHLLGMKSLEK